MVVKSVKYHRNGVCGAGYYAVRFFEYADHRRYECLAIVFDMEGHVAITSDEGTVSFRYEDYVDQLRKFIASPAGQRMAFPYQPADMLGAAP